MKLTTALRVAMYANIAAIFLVPAQFIIVPLVVQIGLMVALLYLRRRERRLRRDRALE